MKALVFADLHFVDYEVWRKFLSIDHSTFDVIWILGDIDIMFLKSISENFKDKQMLGVLGNHDYLGDLEHYQIGNIHGKQALMRDLSLIGIEGCIRYKKGNDMPLHSQEEITNLLELLPYSDIVLSHNSPKGIHDKLDIAHEGYEGLIHYMDKHKPKYVLHGHQHKNIRSKYKESEVIGLYGGFIFDTNTGKFEKVLDLETEY